MFSSMYLQKYLNMISLPFCSRPWKLNHFENRETPTATQIQTREPHEDNCTCWSSGYAPATMALIELGDNAPPENCHRLVILGSSKVGKTSVVSRFLYNKYDENYTPTIEDFHRKIYRIKGEAYRLDILDTSGNHPFPAMRRLSIITGTYSLLCNETFPNSDFIGVGI